MEVSTSSLNVTPIALDSPPLWPPKMTVIAQIDNQPYINETMGGPVAAPRKQTKRLRQAKQKSVTFTGYYIKRIQDSIYS